MATYTLSPNVKRQYFTDSGAPLASGRIYTYLAGTLTPETTYQTSSGTAWGAYVQLDSAGRPQTGEIYLTPGTSYKFIAKDVSGATVWTQDGIGATPSSTVNVDIQGLAGENIAAGDVLYLAVGTEGGTVAGSWYLADASVSAKSSGAVTIAFAVDAITTGSTGTLRMEGAIDLAGPLAPGASYYVATSPGGGEITATAPANARFVGQAQTTTSLVIVPNPVNDNSPDILFIDCMT